jgi:DNA-binding transcriptional MerR regulator
MAGDTLHPISAVARRTGLTIKAIRYYADRGIVPATGRNLAGHRCYGDAAIARLALVRTLRDLGVDLPTISRVLTRQVALPEVAATHAAALATQIRVLDKRRAVLTAVAEQGTTAEELTAMHELATLATAERTALIESFLTTVFTDAAPNVEGIKNSLTPTLPDTPTAAQLAAWVELAKLTQDDDFRDLLRELAHHHAKDGTGIRKDPAAMVQAEVAEAAATGVDPTATESTELVTAVTTRYARSVARPDDESLRRELLTRLTRTNDPRRERYLELLAVINGWARPEPLTPALTWFTVALRTRIPA